MSAHRIVIVGNPGGSNVGESLRRAGGPLGLEATLCDAGEAYAGPRWWRRLSWHLAGRRPTGLQAFGRKVEAVAVSSGARVLISTGLTPLTAQTLARLRKAGLKCLHYSTDDPWNPAQRAPWFLRSLPQYDHIFTTRHSNVDDFRSLGCRNVNYLPFAYDPELFYPEPPSPSEELELGCDVLFVGGADSDRAPVLTAIVDAGLRLALYGDYWGRYPKLKRQHRGRADVPLLRKVTLAAKVNLCLCRRANRDGHVMRSFEIPAIGGFMLAEDTAEHREIYGPEGDCVLYFRGVRELVDKVRWSLSHPDDRQRMAKAAHQRVCSGGYTYQDRLRTMLTLVPT